MQVAPWNPCSFTVKAAVEMFPHLPEQVELDGQTEKANNFLPLFPLYVPIHGTLSGGFHNRTVPSAEQESNLSLTPLWARLHTASVCPINVPARTLGSVGKTAVNVPLISSRAVKATIWNIRDSPLNSPKNTIQSLKEAGIPSSIGTDTYPMKCLKSRYETRCTPLAFLIPIVILSSTEWQVTLEKMIQHTICIIWIHIWA